MSSKRLFILFVLILFSLCNISNSAYMYSESISSLDKAVSSTSRTTSEYTETEQPFDSVSGDDQTKIRHIQLNGNGGNGPKTSDSTSVSRIIDLTGKGGGSSDSPTSLTVRSNAIGAAVYVDGSYKGRTPLTIKNISSGSHSLRLEASGYETRYSAVYCSKGKSNSTFVMMERNKGILDICGVPSDVLVYADGIRQFGTTCYLPEGAHLIKVRKFGYNDFLSTVYITAFRLKKIWITLEPAEFEIMSFGPSKKAFNPDYNGALGEVDVVAEVSAKGTGTTSIKDASGNEVYSKSFGTFTTWEQRAVWNGTDMNGEKVPGGLYTLTFEAEGLKRESSVFVDYSLTYRLLDVTDHGFGIGSVPTAEKMPEDTLVVSFGGQPMYNKFMDLWTFPLDFAVSFTLAEGLDASCLFHLYVDNLQQDELLSNISGAIKYTHTVVDGAFTDFNIGFGASYGYARRFIYPPYGASTGTGLTGSFMLGLSSGPVYAGATTQYTFGATSGNPLQGDCVWRNSLAFSLRPNANIAFDLWGSMHSNFGNYNPVNETFRNDVNWFKAVEAGTGFSAMIPDTSFVIKLSGTFLCFPTIRTYWGGKFSISYMM